MADTYSNLLAHIIFSTKNREPYIDADLKPRLYPYIGGIARNIDCTLLAIGGVEDHVYLLVRYPPRLSVSEMVQLVKANSSKWVHEELSRAFQWQAGFAAFSVSESNVADVKEYLSMQEERHRKLSFKEELIMFLRRHNVDFEEKYLD